MNTAWDDAKTVKLRELCATGLSGSQIGDIIGMTRSSVISKAHRLGLQLRGVPKAKKPAIKCDNMILPRTTEIKLPSQAPMATVDLSDKILGHQVCHFIELEVSNPDWTMCGKPGFPWCEEHKKIVYQKANSVQDADQDLLQIAKVNEIA